MGVHIRFQAQSGGVPFFDTLPEVPRVGEFVCGYDTTRRGKHTLTYKVTGVTWNLPTRSFSGKAACEVMLGKGFRTGG